ncbi:hypothetical protein L0657_06675 [Dyadobacter sp. CY345]|uniref:hypothetical protein n=1 Tax=Dyadobacter sp. CY345 TaxID=2909335 RepID=UPI001F2B485A|nr:hypothetical protein [Dyadobacter sp. CY345]MCF2443634.1 hypothetical protein [Dyadobacter sp. CY345]
MINLTSISAAVEAVKANFQEVCSRSTSFFFDNATESHKRTNREYLSQSEVLMDMLKANKQGENLLTKLSEFRHAVERLKSGDLVNATVGYDVNINDVNFDPYLFLGALLHQSLSDEGLPQEYEEYWEFATAIRNLKVNECLSKYTDFIEHARAMVLLKRPFDEILAMITL